VAKYLEDFPTLTVSSLSFPSLEGPRYGGWGQDKDIRQEDCTGRSRGAVVIFLFGLEALFTRGSRAQFCAVCSLPRTVRCHWLSCLSNQFLLAPREIKPVYYSILSTVWAPGKSCLSTCRHPYSLAQSSYIMSLGSSYMAGSIAHRVHTYIQGNPLDMGLLTSTVQYECYFSSSELAKVYEKILSFYLSKVPQSRRFHPRYRPEKYTAYIHMYLCCR
jgi:hypothetical protein